MISTGFENISLHGTDILILPTKADFILIGISVKIF